MRANISPSCDDRLFYGNKESNPTVKSSTSSSLSSSLSSPLYFMKSKLVLLVSHELSLSGTHYQPHSLKKIISIFALIYLNFVF